MFIDEAVQLFAFVGVEVEDAVADTEVGGHFFGFLRGIEIFLIGDCWAFMRVATRRRPPLDLVEFNFLQDLHFIMISTCADYGGIISIIDAAAIC